MGWLEAWGKGFGVGRCGWVLHGPKIQFGVLDDIKRTFDRDLHVYHGRIQNTCLLRKLETERLSMVMLTSTTCTVAEKLKIPHKN